MGAWKFTKGFDEEQAEDDRERYESEQTEALLEHDLQQLRVSLESLVKAPMDANLRRQMQSLLRSLRGCCRCKRTLGELHSGSCPTGGGKVLYVDLDYREAGRICGCLQRLPAVALYGNGSLRHGGPRRIADHDPHIRCP